ncbi:MAG: response regulator [Planctomycetota bacterium]
MTELKIHTEHDLSREELESMYAGLRMLAVDDESTYVEIYSKYFSKRGFTVDIATDLESFEKQLTACHHHIVLLDYYLDDDDVNGDVLMRMVEQHDRDATVLVVTGRPSLDTAVVSLRQRAFDYLSKPVKIDELAEAVNRALEAKGLLRLSASALQRKIGERIREARKTKSLTLAQMAERTGLSVGFLSQIELGKNSASVETLYRIARALAMVPGEFFQE